MNFFETLFAVVFGVLAIWWFLKYLLRDKSPIRHPTANPVPPIAINSTAMPNEKPTKTKAPAPPPQITHLTEAHIKALNIASSKHRDEIIAELDKYHTALNLNDNNAHAILSSDISENAYDKATEKWETKQDSIMEQFHDKLESINEKYDEARASIGKKHGADLNLYY